jgi:hypothetical protein
LTVLPGYNVGVYFGGGGSASAAKDSLRTNVRECYISASLPAVSASTPQMICSVGTGTAIALHFDVTASPIVILNGATDSALNSFSSGDDNTKGKYLFLYDDSAVTPGYVSQVSITFAVAPTAAAQILFHVFATVGGGVYTVRYSYTVPIAQVSFSTGRQVTPPLAHHLLSMYVLAFTHSFMFVLFSL